MRLKRQGATIVSSILVGSLFLGLVAGGRALFQWFDENEPLLKENSVVVSLPNNSALPSSEESIVNEHAAKLGNMSQQKQRKELDPLVADTSFASGIALSEIGSTPWTDAEYAKLSKLLKSSSKIRKHVALEFRINTDPKKAKRLAVLLGQFDDEIITDVGLELALSGESVSQKNGLALLAKQQPHNAKARGAIVEILQVETTPEILVSALNAVAIPPKTSVTEQQDLLIQFTNLSNNQDPLVRSHSLAMMSRWAGDENVNEYLLQGLNDVDPKVRRTAAYSLVKTQYLSDEVKRQLLIRAQDESENKRTREATLMALARFKLNADDKLHVSNIRRNMR